MAEKRKQCCELLSCSLDDLPQDSLLNSVAGNAATDDFSVVALAFVYLTTPDYEKKEAQRKAAAKCCFLQKVSSCNLSASVPRRKKRCWIITTRKRWKISSKQLTFVRWKISSAIGKQPVEFNTPPRRQPRRDILNVNT